MPGVHGISKGARFTPQPASPNVAKTAPTRTNDTNDTNDTNETIAAL